MFTGKYFDWNQKRLKGIIDHYGHQFFSNKKILDLGCGYADISGPLSRLGADIVAADARKEHLDIASKRYPGVKTVNIDLDKNYPFAGQNFDIILDLGLLCHLMDYEKHLKNVCNSTKFLVLETAVCDHLDDRKSVVVKESKNIFDLSANGLGSRPTTNAIERVLKECGMNFIRIDNSKFNSGSYKYDWSESNNSDSDLNKRRIWFCTKDEEKASIAAPVMLQSLGSIINTELQSSDISLKPNFSNFESSYQASQQVKQASMSKLHPTKSSEAKINFISNLFSNKFFYNKSILDAGVGDGDISAAFIRLGASVTAADARQEHLNNIRKKYPNIKTIRLNFESPLNINTKFDITLSIDTLCHVSNYEKHLRDLCNRSKILLLETAVCDSSDSNINFSVSENSANNTLSFSGLGSRPSAAKIEKILAEQGMLHVRIDDSRLNYENNVYDWNVLNSKNQDPSLRRFWICTKNPHVISEISKKLDLNNNNVTYISASSVNLDDKIHQSSLKDYHHNYPEYKLGDKKFVIVIPSYKNERWAEKNILSALNQNYSKFRIIYTDDCSPDSTFEKVSNVVASHKNKSKTTLIKNKERCGALKNLYDMIYSCDDDEIILTLDGDDWLADNEVLNTLNSTYQNDVWMTYGQYKNYPDNGIGIARQIPKNIIDSNNYRQYPWCSSHLRTFYTWLFKKIDKQDLLHEGKFAPSAWDMYIMYPMLEMAAERARYINKVLYIYNLQNPINDHKVDQKLQQRLDKVCRSKQKYKKLYQAPSFQMSEPITAKSIGLLIIATGKYIKYIDQLINSADRFFFNESHFNVKYFIFTDSNIKLPTSRNYEIINIPHRSFPYASMDRFKHFSNNSSKLSEMNYLYYVDVDCKFVNNVSSEVLGDLVGVRHCGFFNGGGTYEDNIKSSLYLPLDKYKYYYGGGFSGGKSENYLNLSKWCYEMIEKDLSNNIMPRFHDETSLNTYFALNPPKLSLTPSYHYPQSNLQHYKSKWLGNDFEPKIILLDKNHKEIRS